MIIYDSNGRTLLDGDVDDAVGEGKTAVDGDNAEPCRGESDADVE